MALLVASVAWAAPPAPPASASAALKTQGDAAMERSDYAAAAVLYARAFAVAPERDPVLLFNLGRAQQLAGDPAAALRSIEQFAAAASPEVLARAKAPALLEQLRAKTVTLEVACDVPGARVVLDGKELGTTPLPKPTYANVGPGHLAVTADGFAPYAADIPLAAGASALARVHLVYAQSLRLDATPAGAAVVVDGHAEGTLPAVVAVAPGRHVVVVTSPGYSEARTELYVKAGEQLGWTTTLEQPKSIVQRWWFWTAIGAVAAGATVSVALVSTSHGPRAGLLGPVVTAP
jgi:hypothetical protein